MKQAIHRYAELKPAVVAVLVAIVTGAAIGAESAQQRRTGSFRQTQTATTAARVEVPANPAPGTVVRATAGIELVWIPPGECVIGSTDQDLARIEREYSDRKYNDIPMYPHDGGVKNETYAGSGRLTVRFKQGFWMARLETTQGQWKVVMGNNPSLHQGARNRFGKDESMPVERVSWIDAQEFIRKLNQRNDGLTYRLPTDAEWEYAARAGTTGDYAGPLDEMGWYASNSGRGQTDSIDEWKKFTRWAADAPENTTRTWRQYLDQNSNQPNPAGTKKPNGWGLYDMHGNVWEWCRDESSSYHFDVQKDGSPYLKQDEPNAFRMIRGGAFHNLAWSVRSARRIWERGDQKYDTIGFRVVAVATK
ncbi:MAG TPA: formylglycine-generating enzyme family protein [Blastocatellia bacterium]|nr:formylglycine-generating enzyme family protein [Blastocatellia bacterium]